MENRKIVGTIKNMGRGSCCASVFYGCKGVRKVVQSKKS